MGDQKLGIIDEGQRQDERSVDFTLPVIPPFEVVLATPLVIPRDAWTPVPMINPPDLFDKLVAETYAVMGAVYPTSPDNGAFEAIGNVLEEVGAVHSAINGAGRLLHAEVFLLQDGTPGNDLRFLANRVEGAWLDFNAHAVQWDPRLESAHVHELAGQVREVRKRVLQAVPQTWPTPHSSVGEGWPPWFDTTIRAVSTGARRVHVTVDGGTFAVTFATSAADPQKLVIAPEQSPRDLLADACDIIDLLARDEQTLLATIPVPVTPLNPEWHTRRDAIRRRFAGHPCVTPEIFLARKFAVTVGHGYAIALEASDIPVFERAVAPGETRWVAVRSWEAGGQAGPETTTWINAPGHEGQCH